jgi:hypothetical protein
MAQHDYNIANASFPTVRTDINNVLSAINSSNSGSSRPSSAVAGTIWLDTSGAATAQLLKLYDGADDILLGTINFTANTIDWSDSSVVADLVNDTSPQLGGMLDVNGQAIGDGTLELLKFVETASAVNELTITNNSTGNNPILSATGSDTNIGIALTPKGTGEIVIGSGNLNYGGTAVTSTGAELNKLAGAGTLKQAGKETIWIPASAMYGATTNGADAQQVETTAGRPDMKVLDFDASTEEFAQFSVAFPKSWNEGTVTFQYYWTPSNTDTGNVLFQLMGVACGDSDTIDVAYSDGVQVTDAGIGTVEDQQVSAESGALTIAGSPAVDQQVYFQVKRNADDGADTFTGDCRLLGIKIFFTTDAANDA